MNAAAHTILDLIRCLEQVFARGPKLQQLKAANNKFSRLAPEVASLVGLNTVVLDNNSLTELPMVCD